MSAHVELTEQERTDAIAFWREYFVSGGEGRQPSPFQLDAVNDETFRDAFLFWQIGGDLIAFNPEWQGRTDVLTALVEFGESPTPEASIHAHTHVLKLMRDKGVEASDLDTGTVFTLGYVMWLLVGGAYVTAAVTMEKLMDLAMKAQSTLGGDKTPHSHPLSGLGLAAAMLTLYEKAGTDREQLLETSAGMFGLTEESEQTVFAREQVAALELMSKEAMDAKD